MRVFFDERDDQLFDGWPREDRLEDDPFAGSAIDFVEAVLNASPGDDWYQASYRGWRPQAPLMINMKVTDKQTLCMRWNAQREPPSAQPTTRPVSGEPPRVLHFPFVPPTIPEWECMHPIYEWRVRFVGTVKLAGELGLSLQCKGIPVSPDQLVVLLQTKPGMVGFGQVPMYPTYYPAGVVLRAESETGLWYPASYVHRTLARRVAA